MAVTDSPDLTERQEQVLVLVRQGHTNGEIAAQLGISEARVKQHVTKLCGLYGVERKRQLIAMEVAA